MKELKGKAMNSGQYYHKASMLKKNSVAAKTTQGGDLRSRPSGGSQLKSARKMLKESN